MITSAVLHRESIDRFVVLRNDLPNYSETINLTYKMGIDLTNILSPMLFSTDYGKEKPIIHLYSDPIELVTALISSNVGDPNCQVSVEKYFRKFLSEFNTISEIEMNKISELSDKLNDSSTLEVDSIIESNRDTVKLMVSKISEFIPEIDFLDIENKRKFFYSDLNFFCKEINVKTIKSSNVGLNLTNSCNLNNALFPIKMGKCDNTMLVNENLETCLKLIHDNSLIPFDSNDAFMFGEVNNIYFSIVFIELVWLRIRRIVNE